VILSNLIIKLSFRLENLQRYQRIKCFFNDLLQNPKSPMRFPFDLVMISLVISSIAVLIYEVKNDLGTAGQVFELFAVTVFLLEYLLRLWLYSDVHKIIIEYYERAEYLDRPFQLNKALKAIMRTKWEYVTQPMAIIDLLAILPAYRPMRLLRIFLIFRLFKLLRYTNSLKQFTSVLTEKRFELFTLGIFLAFMLFAAAAAIYVFEAEAKDTQIHTLYDAFYWSLVTLSTVGYGDITPQTYQGRAVAMLLIIIGIGVISFFTSIIVAAFTEKLPELNKQHVFNALEHNTEHTLVCGYGRLGQNVARHLQKYKEKIVVIDIDQHETLITLAKQQGILALQGDAESSELLESLNIKRAKRILCLTDSDISNIYITLSARQLNPAIEIIAKANDTENEIKLSRAGANHTISPYATAGLIAAQYAGQPVAFEAFFGLLTDNDPITIDAIRLHEGSDLIEQKIGDIDFQAYKLILFGVTTENDSAINIGLNNASPAYQMKDAYFNFNPPAYFPLVKNDMLIVFGHKYSIAQFKENHGLFNSRS
jgi:voltage-gated potassium channel